MIYNPGHYGEKTAHENDSQAAYGLQQMDSNINGGTQGCVLLWSLLVFFLLFFLVSFAET